MRGLGEICECSTSDKRRQYRQKYYAENSEKVKEKVRAWRAANLERKREYDRNYSKTHREARSLRRHQKGECRPLRTARDTAPWLGVYVAETVLSIYFKNLRRMPYGNPGFDFVCEKGYKIDVKSSCLYRRKDGSPVWNFHIGQNQVADYFLCIAFDNRDDLIPMYIWLIPGSAVNHLVGLGISDQTKSFTRWQPYLKSIDKIKEICHNFTDGHATSAAFERRSEMMEAV